jgi:hypothetical protein
MDAPTKNEWRKESAMKKYTVALIAMTLVPACVYAVDGQVLINQATVNAAGGFPYVISQPGSYKLSGNLILNDANKTAIRIAVDFVTIDLGGFSIIGPNDCSSGVCSANGTGNGIETLTGHVYFNITIRNGTIQGMGDDGIQLWGDSYLLEYLNVRSNGFEGISVARFSLSHVLPSLVTVQHCNADLNSRGIHVEGGRVSHNNVSRNRQLGIAVDDWGSATDNVILENGKGFSGGFRVSYIGNVFAFNTFGNAEGGTNMGQNLCDTAACP